SESGRIPIRATNLTMFPRLNHSMGRDRDRRQKRPHRPRASRVEHARSRLACYTWAAPTTLVGLVAGTLTLGTGGRVQHRRGAVEFHGGFARWFANRIGFDA